MFCNFLKVDEPEKKLSNIPNTGDVYRSMDTGKVDFISTDIISEFGKYSDNIIFPADFAISSRKI